MLSQETLQNLIEIVQIQLDQNIATREHLAHQLSLNPQHRIIDYPEEELDQLLQECRKLCRGLMTTLHELQTELNGGK